MDQKNNPNQNAELAMEQKYNCIDGLINNLPIPAPEEKPVDRVKEPLRCHRSREREER